jgi:ABC-type polysaccharide/polyol phosphate export permease
MADVVKQAWAMALLLGLGAIMGFRVGTGVAGVLGAFGLLLISALALSWVSVLVGVLVTEPERVMVFGFAVMFPLTFVSNVFVPASTMPGWLQSFVDVNPVTLIADAMRGMLVSGPVAGPLTGSLLWALGIMAVFGPLSVRAFRKRT